MQYTIIWYDGNGFRKDTLENEAINDSDTALEAFKQELQAEFQDTPDFIAIVAHEDEVEVTLQGEDF